VSRDGGRAKQKGNAIENSLTEQADREIQTRIEELVPKWEAVIGVSVLNAISGWMPYQEDEDAMGFM